MHRPPRARSHRRWTRARSTRSLWPGTFKDRPPALNAARAARRSGVDRSWACLRHYHASNCRSSACFRECFGLRRLHGLQLRTAECRLQLCRRGNLRRGHWRCRGNCNGRRRCRHHRRRRRRSLDRHGRRSRCRVRLCRRGGRMSDHDRRTPNDRAHRRLARNRRWRRGRDYRGWGLPRLRNDTPRWRSSGRSGYRRTGRSGCLGCCGSCRGLGRGHCRGSWRVAAGLGFRRFPLQDQPHRVARLGDVG
jgi:hypothetical protein